MKMLEAGI